MAFQFQWAVGTECSSARSMALVIGKWSVQAGQSSGLTWHSVKACDNGALQKTLSGHDKLPVLKVLSVGMPAGSGMSMPKVSTRLIKTEAASMFVAVNRWVLLWSSHSRWCLLKSPTHTMLLALLSFCSRCQRAQSSRILLSVSEFSHALYTLVVLKVNSVCSD